MNGIRPHFPFFPTAPIGETVFSVFCRCAERSGLPDTHLMRAFTDQRNTAPLLSVLPGQLRKIADRVPVGHPWKDPAVIAHDHTGLGYFSYFDDETTRKTWLQRYIAASHSTSVLTAMGFTKFPCGAKSHHPRFCLDCARKDDEIYGFSCFHREHQLPGIAVCWKHGTPLAQGCAQCGPYPIKRTALRMAYKCNCDLEITPLPAYASLPDQIEPLLWLAKESAWLVNAKGTRYEDIRNALRNHALHNGLGRGCLLNPGLISDAVENRFGTATLDWLNMPARSDLGPSPWIRRLLLPSASGVKRSPTILYLLVIGALFDSVEAFEMAASGRSELAPKIKATVKSTFDSGTARPKEILARKLWRLLQDGNCGLPGIAQRLGVSVYQLIPIIRQRGWRISLSQQIAKKLGEDKLAAIRMDLRNGVEKIKIQRRYSCSEWAVTLIELDEPGLNDDFRNALKQQTRDRNRSRLESHLANNPTATRTDVITELPGVYDYLITHDKVWFYGRITEKKKAPASPRQSRTNWGVIDREKSRELELLFNEMLSLESKPVRATTNAALKRIKFLTKYMNAPANFPLITKILQEKTESRDGFVKRRLIWAVREMAASGDPISVNKLRRVADLPAPCLRIHKELIVNQVQQLNAAIDSRSFFA